MHLALLLVAKHHVYSNDVSKSTTNDVSQPQNNVCHNDINENGPIIGIDLGSTQSCVGVFENGYANIFSNDMGNALTPSYVTFLKNTTDVVVGEYAYGQALINPESTIFDVKRLIGRKYSDSSIQTDMDSVSYGIINGTNDELFIKVTVAGEDALYTPVEISSMILGKMKATAESVLQTQITQAVVTVPAYFDDAQRQATRDAGAIAGINVKEVINEPYAVAIAYGMDKKSSAGESYFVVLNFGGGAFDVTVMSRNKGSINMIYTNNSDNSHHKVDFIQPVFEYMIGFIKEELDIDISGDNKVLQKLRIELEFALRRLSSHKETRLRVKGLKEGFDFSMVLERALIEKLNSDFFETMLKTLSRAMDDVLATVADHQNINNLIQDVLLVGEYAEILKVKQIVYKYFGDERKVQRGVAPTQAVAKGAAFHGGNLERRDNENKSC